MCFPVPIQLGFTEPHPVLPGGNDVVLRPAGEEWDAVRMPSDLAARVLADLAEDALPPGAVIHDHDMYWFVSAGGADEWVWPDAVDVRVLSRGWVGVPPDHWRPSPDCKHTRGAHWERPIVNRRLLTESRALYAAVQAALAAGFGWREVSAP
jgi:hypothetical protein